MHIQTHLHHNGELNLDSKSVIMNHELVKQPVFRQNYADVFRTGRHNQSAINIELETSSSFVHILTTLAKYDGNKNLK